MYKLFLDFETHDPDLDKKGCGAVGTGEFEILNMAYAIDDGDVQVTEDLDEMREIITNSLILVAHNAVYELHCIKFLGLDVKFKPVFCTRIGAKLQNNVRNSYSLENLSKELLNKGKDQQRFGRLVLDHTFPDGSKLIEFPQKYKKISHKEEKSEEEKDYLAKTYKKYLKKATSFAMSNLKLVSQIDNELVREYAKSDVDLMREIYKLLETELEKSLWSDFSELSKVVTDMRYEGVRIDVEKAKEAWEYLDTKLAKIEADAKEKGLWCNYSSNKELPELLESLGISLPKTNKGNAKTDRKTLATIDHPIVDIITEYKKTLKARDDFVGMLLNTAVDGRIHGEMKILGAGATGRFSHKNPNLAQIPSRDEEIGPMLRGLFIPEEGETWFSGDFSAQEPRLYVHFGSICQKARVQYKEQVYDKSKESWGFADKKTVFDCPSVESLVEAYKEDPQLDSHQFNRDLVEATTGVSLQRSEVKTFALGEAYGKGTKSLAKDLGIEYNKAMDFRKAFNNAAPYIKKVSDYCQYLFHERGYVKTLLGRKNRNDGVEYRAYNYLIQGSAADQTAACLLQLYFKYDIVPKTVVHDEINISGGRYHSKILKKVMETAVKLEIPSYTDIGCGNSWYEAK